MYDDTLIIITAKHGESPIDHNPICGRRHQYAGNAAGKRHPLLGVTAERNRHWCNGRRCVCALAEEGASVTAAVELLKKNAAEIGLGEIFYGPTLALNYNIGGLDPGEDPRSPDIIVTPNVGVTYSGSTTMVGDHGGFAHDDTNVMLLVAYPTFTAQTVSAPTTTTQVAPTIVKRWGWIRRRWTR